MPRFGVQAAIERWKKSGLIPAALAEELAAEQARSRKSRRSHFSQYAVSVMAGLLLVIAAVTFFAWSWPALSTGARACTIAFGGVVVLVLGMRLEAARRSLPVAYALQASGLALLLAAYIYSVESWPNRTLGGVVAGMLALATPIVTLPLFIRRNSVMPAVAAALGYGFLAVFLVRALDLDAGTMIWVLDGVLLATIVVLVRLLVVPGPVSRSTLNTFMVHLYAAFPLAALTAGGPLDLGDGAWLALDGWLLLVTGLALWGIHRAPERLRSRSYMWQLAASVLLAIPMVFGTLLEMYSASPPATAAVLAGVGAAGLWYGLRERARQLVICSCVTIVSAAWYLGAFQGERLGTVLALLFTAVLFFRVAVLLGKRKDA